MKRSLCAAILALTTFSLTAFADDPIIYTIEPGDDGKLVFPTVKVGDTVRFRQSSQRVGGDVKVSVQGGAKLARASLAEAVVGGRVLPTGTKNMEFEIKAEKAGKATITVAVKAGNETTSTDYSLKIE